MQLSEDGILHIGYQDEQSMLIMVRDLPALEQAARFLVQSHMETPK